jgi:cytoskeleton protein RodZ
VGSFGEDLRKERVSRGIALETISGSTKIVARYLTALEGDQFAALPGGILSKGFVRSYARAVGLDENAWVERFLSASQHPIAEETDADWAEFARNVGRTRARGQRRPEMRLRWAGVLLLVLVLGGLGWFVYRYVSGRVLAGEEPHHAVNSTAVASTGSDPGQ